MPELPEVETTKRGIEPAILNQTIRKLTIRNGRLRWPVDPKLVNVLPGLQINKVERRAKYLILHTSKGHLILHLGMSGHLKILSCDSPIRKHDHIDLVFENNLCLRYHDPRRFGAWLWTEQAPEAHPLLSKLGPEPLTSDFNAEDFFQRIQTTKTAIKAVIMNNQFVVGVGNIYANESLFLAGIHPLKPANQLNIKQLAQLVDKIKQVLEAAIQQGGTTLKDFQSPDCATVICLQPCQPGLLKMPNTDYSRGAFSTSQLLLPKLPNKLKTLRRNLRSD